MSLAGFLFVALCFQHCYLLYWPSDLSVSALSRRYIKAQREVAAMLPLGFGWLRFDQLVELLSNGSVECASTTPTCFRWTISFGVHQVRRGRTEFRGTRSVQALALKTLATCQYIRNGFVSSYPLSHGGAL